MKTLEKFLSSFLLLALFAMACSKDDPIGDKTKPQPVTDPVVTNLPGAAIIQYTLPDDPNLLYVRAEYERNGEKLDAKASFYYNYILVEGFGDTQQREIKLYTVTRAGVSSAAVSVTIEPKRPAIYDVLESLKIDVAFGGMITQFTNLAAENVVIGVLRWNTEDDRLHEWVTVDNFYTALPSGKFAVRRQKAVPTKFGYFIRDRWNNRTDTLEVELTPWYEEQLDKKKIARVTGKPVPQLPPLPESGIGLKDPVGNLGSWPFANLFDDTYGNTGYHTNERNDIPIWVAMDLGVTAKLSRYKFWQRNSGDNCGFCYSHGNPHEWQIWGTNDINDVNSWVMLDHQIMVKPSGLPVGLISNEDKAAADAGHEYDFALDSPPVRYIAFKHIDNWGAIEGAKGFMHIAELEFWGQIK